MSGMEVFMLNEATTIPNNNNKYEEELWPSQHWKNSIRKHLYCSLLLMFWSSFTEQFGNIFFKIFLPQNQNWLERSIFIDKTFLVLKITDSIEAWSQKSSQSDFWFSFHFINTAVDFIKNKAKFGSNLSAKYVHGTYVLLADFTAIMYISMTNDSNNNNNYNNNNTYNKSNHYHEGVTTTIHTTPILLKCFFIAPTRAGGYLRSNNRISTKHTQTQIATKMHRALIVDKL